MEEDFYCNQVFSRRVEVEKVAETENVLAYFHTRPFWQTHIVVVPKKHVASLLAIESDDYPLLIELMEIVKSAAEQVLEKHGACRVVTNLGRYQDSKHLHWHVYGGERIG